ncbi:thioredoxin family protein [Stieleria varia]|uniref:Thiol:disulfide interchange protein n=1 Tax=Stieleria varia TaxID=2528005 RepID=A0A5C6B0V6_9BACT|nr:thiol:disulfide interchange protein precursor [Stieleria varia]
MRFGLRSLIIVLILSVFATAWLHEREQTLPLDWERYSAQRVRQATETGRVVLVSLIARWDVACISNEPYAIHNQEMIRFIRNNKVVLLRADITDGDLEATRLMQRLGLKSVPAFIVHSPCSPDAPVVLSDLTKEQILRDSISQARNCE